MNNLLLPSGSGAEIRQSIYSLRRRLRFLYQFWWVTHYATGLIGVVAGTLLTAIGSASPGDSMLGAMQGYAWLCGIVATVATSLVTFLGPIQKAERYWSAYHVLDQALLEYQLGLIQKRELAKYLWEVRKILLAKDSEIKTSDTHEREHAQEESADDKGFDSGVKTSHKPLAEVEQFVR